MEMKARLGKIGNDSLNLSDPKHYKAMKDTNNLNIYNLGISQKINPVLSLLLKVVSKVRRILGKKRR